MANDIEKMVNQFVKNLNPKCVYLFGSTASGTDTSDSDYDFYIVVENYQTDILSSTRDAYRSVRGLRTRPVDIIVNTEDHFEKRKQGPTLEKEVFEKGVLMYDR